MTINVVFMEVYSRKENAVSEHQRVSAITMSATFNK
jgi:hypothetical protein